MRDGMKPEFNLWNSSEESGKSEGVVYSAWNGTKKALGLASDEE